MMRVDPEQCEQSKIIMVNTVIPAGSISVNKIAPQDSTLRSLSLWTNFGAVLQQPRKSIKFKFDTLLLLLLPILLLPLYIVCGLVSTLRE